ncbi:MAG: YkgJ family cysteine cluster protein [Gammaproteobacteria bacterium]
MQPFYMQQALRFSCTQCGQCCATAGEYYVYLNDEESERIRAFVHLSRGWFRRRYLQRLDGGDRVLASGPDERCIFLDSEGSCRVYAVRPVQCRTYPFWPELLGSAAAWNREARRCEGINQGRVVARSTIRRALRECIEQQQQGNCGASLKPVAQTRRTAGRRGRVHADRDRG